LNDIEVMMAYKKSFMILHRLRYEKQIKALRLLSLEMLHRRVEIEKQDFRKKY